jgi:hypothetical protein
MVVPLASAKVSRNLEFLGVKVAESLSVTTLPVKSGSGWIVVRSAAADTSLPSAGTRVTPAFRNQMPRILGPAGSPALMRAPGAHHFRFIAVEFAPQAGTCNNGLVRLGTGSETKSTSTYHSYDRCQPRYPIRLSTSSRILISKSMSNFLAKCAGDASRFGRSSSRSVLGWGPPADQSV